MAATAKIIFDTIIQKSVFTGSPPIVSFDIPISSQDCVLVVFGSFNTTTALTALFNNAPMTQLIAPAPPSGGASGAIWYISNPPVGVYPFSLTATSATFCGVTAMVILGADKKVLIPQTFSAQLATGASTAAITFPLLPADSLVVDMLAGAYGSFPVTYTPTTSEQTQVANESAVAATTTAISGSYIVPSGNAPVTMGWTASANNSGGLQIAIALEPAQAPSIWFPTMSPRQLGDINVHNADGIAGSPASFQEGYKPLQFYINSFLHTIGRFHPPPPAIIVGETETPTSQIIIDKIVQAEIGGGSTLTVDVLIPSQDAVLLVTGGSVIATGGAWQSVSFNGDALIKQVQAGVAGNSAEIWYMPNPPVGVYPLTIVPTATFGQVYVNAMVLLGVDKKDVNLITASNTDALASTSISTSITPDAPNSVVIDVFVGIDAVSQPAPDPSQTQIFNPTSINTNEYVLTTHKISSSQTNMTYQLSTNINAALVAVCLRPAQAPSIWFPVIGLREIDDVVTTNGLDSGTTLTGNYGYKESMFYLNSFTHTVGRSGFGIPVLPIKVKNFGYKESNFYLQSFLHTIGRIPEQKRQSGSTLFLMGVG